MGRKPSLKKKLLLVFWGIFLSLVLLELGLRIGGIIFFAFQEHRNRPSLKEKGEYRILCLGESTTASGGRYAYPRRLEEILNRTNIGVNFQVFNRGLNAQTTTGLLFQLEEDLKKYKPDMVIVIMGINDEPGILPYKLSGNFAKLKIYKLFTLLYAHLLK